MSTFPNIEDLGLGGDAFSGVNHRRKVPRKRVGELFLKGPVPMGWLSRAGRLPGRALHVGVVLWMLSGIKRSGTVVLGSAHLREMGVDRHAVYRALRHLEAGALISVSRNLGRAPCVTLLDAEHPAGRSLR
jgi:hypothetical protein